MKNFNLLDKYETVRKKIFNIVNTNLVFIRALHDFNYSFTYLMLYSIIFSNLLNTFMHILNKLQYQTHLLLNSKYRIFISVIIYRSIIYFYNSYINDNNIAVCMKNTEPIESGSADINIIAQLATENIYLKERIATLERELLLNTERLYTDKYNYESHIKTLEENQGHLIAEIRSLKEQASEASDTIGEMAGSNVDLRSDAAERQESYDASRRDFETARKQYEDATDDLRKTKKQR